MHKCVRILNNTHGCGLKMVPYLTSHLPRPEMRRSQLEEENFAQVNANSHLAGIKRPVMRSKVKICKRPCRGEDMIWARKSSK